MVILGIFCFYFDINNNNNMEAILYNLINMEFKLFFLDKYTPRPNAFSSRFIIQFDKIVVWMVFFLKILIFICF